MTDPETIALYDAKADDYAALNLSDSQKRAMTAFTKDLPAAGHILDLGCGPGHHGALFLAQGFQVTGTDATPAFVKAARARGLDARLETFAELDDTAEYDGIWASFSLLHLPRADFPEALARAARALKTGGRLYLGMKTGTRDHRDSLGRLYGLHRVEELHRHLAVNGLRVLWQETGSEVGFAGTNDPFVMMVATHA